MKKIIILLILFTISACQVIKPLPGKDSVTVGKEGIGIDVVADKVMSKTDQVIEKMQNFKKTGQLSKTVNTEVKSDIPKIKLNDVAGTGGSAVASRLYKNGQFTLSVLAELPVSKEGFFYEAWMVKTDPLEFISAGKLTYETDGQYHLNYIVNNDYSAYNKITITLEPDDGNISSASPVLDGVFDEIQSK